MPKIDFFITSHTEMGRLQLTCQKVALAYEARRSVYIQCATIKEAAMLDELLWTSDDISFIPHNDPKVPVPVLIGTQEWPEHAFDVLVNLHPDLPPKPEQFSQIIEIICQNPELKNIGRVHYKAYQTAGFPLESHNL
jgi:DNA polymerase-3 subunit chi